MEVSVILFSLKACLLVLVIVVQVFETVMVTLGGVACSSLCAKQKMWLK